MASHRPFTVSHPSLSLPPGQGTLVLAIRADGALLVANASGLPAPLRWLPAEECEMTGHYFDDDERWSEAFRIPPAAHGHA